jgi:hypothetical protein
LNASITHYEMLRLQHFILISRFLPFVKFYLKMTCKSLLEFCESLEDKTTAKGKEIEEVKERVSFLESWIGGLI